MSSMSLLPLMARPSRRLIQSCSSSSHTYTSYLLLSPKHVPVSFIRTTTTGPHHKRSHRRSAHTDVTVATSAHEIMPNTNLDLTFNDTQEAYKSKTNFELLRALVVLKLSSFDFLIQNHRRLIKLSRTILGSTLFRFVMQCTFYGHFVAGEDEEKIRPTLDRLRSFGVKSILDYSAEEDISEEQVVENEMKNMKIIEAEVTEPDSSPDFKQFIPQKDFADRRKLNPSARTYFYLNEAQCEKNVETFLKCIEAVAGVTGHTGLAAIKLTALGRPQILLQLSEVIARTKCLFQQVTGEEGMVKSHVSPAEFQAKYRDRFNIDVPNNEVNQWLKNMDYDQRGLMNLFSWNGLVDMKLMMSEMFQVPHLQSGRMRSVIKALSSEEDEMFRNMMRRIHLIARTAKEKDVRVMIDAEQSYFQPAIHRITLELMRKYNDEKAIIFNTYQCYLKNAYDTFTLDLELARRQNFFVGAKLVRGAYIEQERARAAQGGYEDPINPTFESTTEMYHKCLSEAMGQIISTGIDKKKISIMVASHNEDTVRFTVKKMDQLGIRPEHRVICFGQLYGMCDHVSFPLGQNGYSVYKYVPYGPVEEVIPYLSRRGAENHGILEKVLKERRLLRQELVRRLSNGQIFYKPVGNYSPI